MKELDRLIAYWKSKLFYDKWMLEPSTEYNIEQTVKKLEELRAYYVQMGVK